MEKIQDYAIIGNGRSVALISSKGSIDWLCWPLPHSKPVLAGILDVNQGSWSISPKESFQTRRCYIHNTPILQTTLTTSQGTITLTDLMPVGHGDEVSPEHEILRKVECIEGSVTCTNHLTLYKNNRFTEVTGWMGQRTIINGGALIIRGNKSLDREVRLEKGEIAYYSLNFSTEAPAVLINFDRAEMIIDQSIQWWQSYCEKISYQGLYRDLVVRSALTLKLLGYAPSGAILASETSSLPERIGGDLNWDYRYCWLRDTSMTTEALMDLGLLDEAKAFVSWLIHATNLSRPRLKVLYDIYGRRPQKERECKDLSGYQDSRPVRFGNKAATQIQLDIYGEVVCSAVRIFENEETMDRDTQRMLKQVGEYICKNWNIPDAGMWEIRGETKHFTHSKLLCWAGLDGLLKLHKKGLIELPAQKMAAVAEQIKQYIHNEPWSGIDANLLLLTRYGLFMPNDKRIEETYQSILRHLSAGDGLLYRNKDEEEGAFILCSFWMIEYLISKGDVGLARNIFEKVCGYANDVGLFGEELDPVSKDHLGNFPLAFSHAGLINAAFALNGEKSR
jgi:GH15 family glucan-1,4-alpha-glucosidase